jgi:hypothetical protein
VKERQSPSKRYPCKRVPLPDMPKMNRKLKIITQALGKGIQTRQFATIYHSISTIRIWHPYERNLPNSNIRILSDNTFA